MKPREAVAVPAPLTRWVRLIAKSIPARSAMTVVELVVGSLADRTRFVTRAISAIAPRRSWQAYFWMLEKGRFGAPRPLDAICRILQEEFPEPRRLLVVDDTMVLRASKAAPGAAFAFDHAKKPNRPAYVLAQNIVAAAAVVGPKGGRRGVPLLSLLAEPGTKRHRGACARALLGALAKRLGAGMIALLDAGFMSRPTVEQALKLGFQVIGQGRSNTALFREPAKRRPRGRPRKYGRRVGPGTVASLPTSEKRLKLWGETCDVRWRDRVCLARFLGGRMVRAVWVEIRKTDGNWAKARLLLSTDLALSAEEIVTLYADRWAIEPLFHALKNFEGMKEVWMRTRKVLSRWLQVLQAGRALLELLAVKTGLGDAAVAVFALGTAGGWRRETAPTAGMMKVALVRALYDFPVERVLTPSSRKFRPPAAAGPTAAALAA